MAKKETTSAKRPLPFTSPLVQQTEQKIIDGYQAVEEKENGTGGGARQKTPQPSAQERTKGVQAYIPMSMYRRLNNLKYERGETIGNLLVQAIGEWLETQE